MKLSVTVQADEFTAKVAQAFDLDFSGTITTEIPEFSCPDEFGIGMIVGSSGSGKSQILKHHFDAAGNEVTWDSSKAVVSHFDNPDEAIEKLFACGLASVPTLCKPYHVLSNGERYRANVARNLRDGMILDEFTSEVNRETAKSLSVALSKYIRTSGISGIVLSSCHKDIIDWIQPDWVFDCDSGERFNNDDPRQSLKRVARISIL